MYRKTVFSLVLLLATFLSSANIHKASIALEKEQFKEAKVYLEQSAEIGNAQAQFILGILHYEGKAGAVDKDLAISWLFLASEYNYPNAIEYAAQIFQSLSPAEQEQATKISGELRNKYGKASLQESIYPTIKDIEIQAQKISHPAQIIKRGELHYNSGLAGSINNATITNAIARGDGGALNNLGKTLINDDSGIVLVKYNVALDGRSRDPEILFSMPAGRFDVTSLSSIYTSKFRPAKFQSDSKEQFGLVAGSHFFIQGADNLRKDYPHLHKRFRSLRSRLDEGPEVKYVFANFLRAYQNLLSETEAQAFDVILLEAAKEDYAPAQVAYAEFQIYQNNDIEAGLPWLIKAAKVGFPAAEYRLGELAYFPTTAYLEKDADKSIFWLTKAAEAGHKRAQLKLIEVLHKEDTLTVPMATKAIAWLDDINGAQPLNPSGYYLAAVAHNILQDTSEAKDYIDSAIEIANAYAWKVDDWIAFKNSLAAEN